MKDKSIRGKCHERQQNTKIFQKEGFSVEVNLVRTAGEITMSKCRGEKNSFVLHMHPHCRSSSAITKPFILEIRTSVYWSVSKQPHLVPCSIENLFLQRKFNQIVHCQKKQPLNKTLGITKNTAKITNNVCNHQIWTINIVPRSFLHFIFEVKQNQHTLHQHETSIYITSKTSVGW